MQKELTEDELNVLIKQEASTYFDENGYKNYRKYLLDNLHQLGLQKNIKDFFKMLFVHDYNVLVYSKHDKELVDLMLECLGISPYVSVRLEETNNCQKALHVFSNQKNVMVVTDSLDDIKLAKAMKAQTVLTTYSKEFDAAMEAGPTEIINNIFEMNNFIIE